MTPDKQRAAIAEACGIVTHDHWGPLYRTPHGIVRVCPDFLNDLNAMHEAEKALWPMEPIYLTTYCEILMRSRYPSAWGDVWNYVHATAGQRAEAFLKTLGLWEESTQPQ